MGHDVSLKSLSRSADPDTPTLWYAQDAAGAIWKVDITSSHTVRERDLNHYIKLCVCVCVYVCDCVSLFSSEATSREVDQLP